MSVLSKRYQLSEQYTARTLMDMYKDSILEELKAYSLMEYNLLRASKMEFTDDSHLHLVLENTIIAQTRSHEIVEFLEKIVCERCGMNLIVDLDFEEPKESRYKKNSDLQIQFEIKNILKNINLKDEDGETVAVASDANEKSAASGQTTTSGDSGSTGGGNAVKPEKTMQNLQMVQEILQKNHTTDRGKSLKNVMMVVALAEVKNPIIRM